MIIPWQDLDSDTLNNLLEHFVLQEGTEYGEQDVSLADITGPGFSEDGVVDAIERATNLYVRERTEGERFVDTFRRIGMAPFKEAIYG